MIDEPTEFSVMSPPTRTPPPNQEAASSKDGLPEIVSSIDPGSINSSSNVRLDPQGVGSDLQQLSETLDKENGRVLHKLHAQSVNHEREINSLQDQLGPLVTTTHYFLSGEAEPQFFKNSNTVMENILGLKNSSLRNRRSLDSFVTKYNQEIPVLKSALTTIKTQLDQIRPGSEISSSQNAVPNADEICKYKDELAKIQKDLKTELAKASSLSAGSAFSALDLKARMVELENANKHLTHKLECVSKAVGVLKNERPSVEQGTNVLDFEIKRMKERLDELEKEDSNRHSRNLFSDCSESKITLMEKEIEELQKNSRLQLADSDMNQWLKRKQIAFLETPEMAERFKREFRLFGSTWVIQPRNMSKEMREIIVEVSFL